MSNAPTSYRYEAWTEYGIAILVLFLRYFAKWKTVGFRRWEGDDYAAVLVLGFWTLAVLSLDLIVQDGTNLGITDDIGKTLSSEEIATRELWSKCILAGRNVHVTLVWLLKACMLFFYNRVVRNLPQQVFVKWTGMACIFAYVGVIATVWFHCMPVQKHWQVITNPGDGCTHARAYYVTLVILNVTTDIAIVSIPLPWLPMLKVTFWRKVAIGALLSSGFLIIAAATVRCVLTLLNIESIFTACMWSIREPFVAIITVNAGVIKPLFSKSRWFNTREEGSPTPDAHKQNNSFPNQLPLGPSMTGSTLHPDIDKSAVMKDIESGDNSNEHIIKSSDYMGWLRREISDSCTLGERNGSADAEGTTDKTST